MPSTEIIEGRTNRLFIFLSIPLSLIVAFVLVKVAPIYALIAAIGLGLLIVTFTNTDFALYVLIFSMLLSPEFGSRTTRGGGVTIRIDDIILAIIIFSWLAKTAINKELGLFRRTPLNKPIWIYTFICALSTGFGMMAGRVNVLSGFFFLIKYIQYFMIYFMVVNHVQTKKQIDNYLISLIITFVIVTVLALIQIPTGRRVTAPFEGDAGEPNTLGGYLIFIIAINLSLLLTPGVFNSTGLRRGLYIITTLSVIPFLMTNSRGSWAAAIPVVIAYIILSKRRWIIVGFLAIFIAIAPYVFPASVVDRVKYTFTKQQGYAATLQENIGGLTIDTSASERIRSWREAFNDIPKHPLLGFGITGWRFLDAQYMRVLIETGAVGLAAFLYLLYSILNSTRKIFSTAKIPVFRAFAQGFLVATIAMMTHSLGANTFIIIRIMEPFWLVCGLIMAIPEVEKIESDKLLEMEERISTVKMGHV
ncbi:MAG: O-antigen ligase family protein [Candidatus Marinimicrobia bacterium]|nr:O-antigen ligase family protein [Candidatus Neomarinimicrobiota bacterium]